MIELREQHADVVRSTFAEAIQIIGAMPLRMTISHHQSTYFPAQVAEV